MAPARKIFSLILWLLYGLAVTTHVAHHAVEAMTESSETRAEGPCQDCLALGALGLLLVTTPRLPGALRRLAATFLLVPAPAVAPKPAPRRRPRARGPPA